MAAVSKTSNNFGKKKNSYGCAGQFNADKLLAKYRQTRNSDGGNHSFSTNNIDPNSNALVASIREKNSRNIEKFGDKGVLNSSKMEVKESNSQYLINSENMNSDSITQNKSFDVNNRQRMVKPKKKKEDATKALLNFEDMKKKILQDYVKKNTKEINSNVAQPSHHRNGNNLINGYFSHHDDISKQKDIYHKPKTYSDKDDEFMYLNECGNSKKKHKKSSNKGNLSAIYDLNQGNNWNSQQPLSQKSINTNGSVNLKERPSSNKKHTPSKKHNSKSSGNFK